MDKPIIFSLEIGPRGGVIVDVQVVSTSPPDPARDVLWPTSAPTAETIRYTFTSTHPGGRAALIDAASSILHQMSDRDRITSLERMMGKDRG